MSAAETPISKSWVQRHHEKSAEVALLVLKDEQGFLKTSHEIHPQSDEAAQTAYRIDLLTPTESSLSASELISA